MSIKRLSKTLALLCALCITAVIPPCVADELPMNKTLLASEFSNGIYTSDSGDLAHIDGKLHFVSDTQLHSVDPETGQVDSWSLPLAEERSIPGIMGFALLEENGSLRLLDIDRGLLYPMTLKKGNPELQEPLALEWDDFIALYHEHYSHDMRPTMSFILTADTLWVLQEDTMLDIGPNFKLTCFDLQSGKQNRPDIPSVGAITPYRDGKMLITTALEFSEDGGITPGNLAILDPGVLSIENLFPMKQSPWSISYDQITDTLYAAVGLELYKYEGLKNEAAICASLPEENYTGRMTIMGPEQVAYLHYRGLSLCDTNALRYIGKTPLVFLGSLHQPGISETAAQLPEYRVTDHLDRLSLTERLLTDLSSFDMSIVKSSGEDFRAVMDKGYALDLSQVDKIKQYVANTYPSIQDAVMKDGKIYGIPTSTISLLYGYDKAFFDDIGQKPPASFIELANFIKEWDEQYADDYPERSAIENWDPRSSLIRQALEVYQAQMVSSGDPFTWDTQLLRRMLGAIDAIEFETLPQGQYPEYKAPVITLHFFITSANSLKGQNTDDYIYLPLLLPADEGLDAIHTMDIDILFINAATQSPQAALRFAEQYIDNIPAHTKALMMPSENSPVLNPSYQRTLNNMERELTEMNNSARNAEGAGQRELLQRAENYAKEVEHYRETEQWAAAEQDIAAYRELAKYNDVIESANYINLYDVQELTTRYADRQIDMEQFISELEGKTRLMMLENK